MLNRGKCKPEVWKKIQTYLAAGLLLVLPAFITGYILWLVFVVTDRLLGALLEKWTGLRIPGMGLLAVIVLLALAGLFATNYIGKRVIQWTERLLAKVPIIGAIYGTTRQFAEALSSPERGVFRRVVLVEYPRRGMYSVGFLTGAVPAGISGKDKRLVSVFVPTVPNLTTGFLVHVPPEELTYPPVGVDEGLKYVISAGVVKPTLGGDGEEFIP